VQIAFELIVCYFGLPLVPFSLVVPCQWNYTAISQCNLFYDK